MDKFISGTTVKKQFDIATVTLNRWADDGKVKFVKGPGGRRLYSQIGIYNLFNLEFPSEPIITPTERVDVCYCRVSSAHQSEDLKRQIEFLSKEYPGNEIISDIGSGLNWKRKGFISLLDRVYKGEIGKVVVAYKDRMCRFGVELVQFIFKKAGTTLVVHNDNENSEENKELSDDLLAVVTSFVARANGRRSGVNRRRREQQSRADSEADREAENGGEGDELIIDL